MLLTQTQISRFSLVLAATFLLSGCPNGKQGSIQSANTLLENDFLLTTVLVRVDRINAQGQSYPGFLYNQKFIFHHNLIEKSILNLPSVYPASPIIENYHSVRGPLIFGAQFPSVFFGNVPKSIQNIIHSKNIENVEIFFTPQFNGASLLTANDPALKAHFWVLPDIRVDFPGELYRENLLMAIFDSDRDIQRHLKNDVLTTVDVHLHGNTYSPQGDTGGGLAFDVNSSGKFEALSFWSVVIDQKLHKAAVTLHWLLDNNPANYKPFEDSLVQGAHMADLLEAWDKIPGFQGPLMNKLKALVYGSTANS